MARPSTAAPPTPAPAHQVGQPADEEQPHPRRVRRKAWERELESFLHVNQLPHGGNAHLAMQALDADTAVAVMGRTGLYPFKIAGLVRDRSAVVLSRIRQLRGR